MKIRIETMFGAFLTWICSDMLQKNLPKQKNLSLLLFRLPVIIGLIQYPMTTALLNLEI